MLYIDEEGIIYCPECGQPVPPEDEPNEDEELEECLICGGVS